MSPCTMRVTVEMAEFRALSLGAMSPGPAVAVPAKSRGSGALPGLGIEAMSAGSWSAAIEPVEAEYGHTHTHTPNARPCRRLSFQHSELRGSPCVGRCGTAFTGREYRA